MRFDLEKLDVYKASIQSGMIFIQARARSRARKPILQIDHIYYRATTEDALK